MPDHTPSLYLDRMWRFTSILADTADLRHHTGITLQVVPKTKYTLRLLVDNEEREINRTNNRTWEPAQPLYAPRFSDIYTEQSLFICRDASPTSQIRVEIQVKSSLFSLGKKEQGGEEIDCQEIFKDYWNATAHEFPVQGRSESPISPRDIVDREGAVDVVAGKHSFSLELQFSAGPTVSFLAISQRGMLMTFA